jgi:hypothetical protein
MESIWKNLVNCVDGVAREGSTGINYYSPIIESLMRSRLLSSLRGSVEMVTRVSKN